MRRYSWPRATSKKALIATLACSHGSLMPLTALRMRLVASSSTRAKTASKRACLPLKWW